MSSNKKDEFKSSDEDIEVDSSDSSDDETAGVETSIRPIRVGFYSAHMAQEEQMELALQQKLKKEHDEKAKKTKEESMQKKREEEIQNAAETLEPEPTEDAETVSLTIRTPQGVYRRRFRIKDPVSNVFKFLCSVGFPSDQIVLRLHNMTELGREGTLEGQEITHNQCYYLSQMKKPEEPNF